MVFGHDVLQKHWPEFCIPGKLRISPDISKQTLAVGIDELKNKPKVVEVYETAKVSNEELIVLTLADGLKVLFPCK